MPWQIVPYCYINGQVIGGAFVPDFGADRDVLLWFNGQPVDLRDYLLGHGVPEVGDWNALNSVTAVSSDGQTIAGWGVGPDFLIHGFVVSLSPSGSKGD